MHRLSLTVNELRFVTIFLDGSHGVAVELAGCHHLPMRQRQPLVFTFEEAARYLENARAQLSRCPVEYGFYTDTKPVREAFGAAWLAVAIAVGALLVWGPKLPWPGKLPGDIRIERESFSLYFPLTTSLVASAILKAVFALFRR